MLNSATLTNIHSTRNDSRRHHAEERIRLASITEVLNGAPLPGEPTVTMLAEFDDPTTATAEFTVPKTTIDLQSAAVLHQIFGEEAHRADPRAGRYNGTSNQRCWNGAVPVGGTQVGLRITRLSAADRAAA